MLGVRNLLSLWSQIIKKIDTLVPDIEEVLLNGVTDVPEEKVQHFGQLVAKTMFERLNEKRKEFTLRLSNIGNPCVRKLWLDKWKPEGKEPLRASTKLKFLYGDLIELLVLFLADLAGHEVKDQQKERNLYGIKGHSDATIDGRIIDAKSASTFSFNKFRTGLKPEADSFGYLGQIGGYHKSALDDISVTDKQRASFLVIDKQHGHLVLDTHEFNHDEIDWETHVKRRIDDVNNPDVIPERAFPEAEDGYTHKDTKQFIPNGNKKLPVNCSYCDQKFNCYDNIRIFLSSKGPVYFTKIVKEPRMKEVSREEYINPTQEVEQEE